jgi:hypothetical protein
MAALYLSGHIDCGRTTARLLRHTILIRRDSCRPSKVPRGGRLRPQRRSNARTRMRSSAKPRRTSRRRSRSSAGRSLAKEELDKTKIATRALYQKGFQFAEVARNDYAAEQLEELEIAEKNFNANIDNKDLLESFLNTAASVKKNLQSKYQDQWTEPAATAEAGPKEDSGDE